MGKSKFVGAVAIAVTLLLAGCAPITARGQEHKVVIEKVLKEAETVGLGIGTVEKDCAVPFDCSANDLYHSTTTLAASNLTDTVVCEKLIVLGKSVGLGMWRRDYHDVEESGLDQSNMGDGLKACVEAIGVNSGDGNAGQSEGFLLHGAVRGEGDTQVSVNIQINSVSKPEWSEEFDRGYYFLVQTTEG